MNVVKKMYLLALVACFNSNPAIANPAPDLMALAQSMTGAATPEERLRVARLFQLMVELSQQPERITLDTIVSTGATTEFHLPFCVHRTDGRLSCSHTALQFLPPGVRLNQLRTFTVKLESDAGAEVNLEIDPEFACLPRAALQQAWGVAPVDGPVRLYDFFGEQDNRPPIQRQLYHQINPTAPYVFVEASSVNGCVTSLHLSALQPGDP